MKKELTRAYMKEKVKVKVSLLKPDLSGTQVVEVDFKIEGQNEAQDFIYRYDLPDYIYNILVDQEPKYQSFKNHQAKERKHKRDFNADTGDCIKHTYKDTSISRLVSKIQSISTDALSYSKRESYQKTKKIFISFTSSANHERDSWQGAYMGLSVSNDFQYFIGYEIKERDLWKGGLISQYYTYAQDSSGEGSKLSSFYAGSNRKHFIEKYKIIDWTQEREDFLKKVQDGFKKLNEQLTEFLGDLTNDKLDSLMAGNKIKLLTAGEAQ